MQRIVTLILNVVNNNSNATIAIQMQRFKCIQMQLAIQIQQIAIQMQQIAIHDQMQQIAIHFQISPFTKYDHHGSLMNYTTGMSKHTCIQSQQHSCHVLQLFNNLDQLSIRIQISFSYCSKLATHDDVTRIKVFNLMPNLMSHIAIHISVRQITFQRIQVNEQHNDLLNPHHSNIKAHPYYLQIITAVILS